MTSELQHHDFILMSFFGDVGKSFCKASVKSGINITFIVEKKRLEV